MQLTERMYEHPNLGTPLSSLALMKYQVASCMGGPHNHSPVLYMCTEHNLSNIPLSISSVGSSTAYCACIHDDCVWSEVAVAYEWKINYTRRCIRCLHTLRSSPAYVDCGVSAICISCILRIADVDGTMIHPGWPPSNCILYKEKKSVSLFSHNYTVIYTRP